MIEVCTMADAKGAAGERREQQISLRLPAGALEAVDRARLGGAVPAKPQLGVAPRCDRGVPGGASYGARQKVTLLRE